MRPLYDMSKAKAQYPQEISKKHRRVEKKEDNNIFI